MSRPVRTSLSVIEDALGPLEGKHVLDLGCGHGALAKALVRRGAEVTGVDPQIEAVEAAEQAVPEARFVQAGAEHLPHRDGLFDAVVILNALHHVPAPLMRAALREAVRVSAGPVLVIEPLAEGSFFEAVRLVDDETEVRALAQAALTDAIAAGDVTLVRMEEYEDRRAFSGPEALLRKIVEVDPARAEIAARRAPEVVEVVRAVAEPQGEGFVLIQPHRAHLLRRPS